jgi:hypothetical protein
MMYSIFLYNLFPAARPCQRSYGVRSFRLRLTLTGTAGHRPDHGKHSWGSRRFDRKMRRVLDFLWGVRDAAGLPFHAGKRRRERNAARSHHTTRPSPPPPSTQAAAAPWLARVDLEPSCDRGGLVDGAPRAPLHAFDEEAAAGSVQQHHMGAIRPCLFMSE